MSKKGFTLVELLATIVIIAFIMGIVLPSATRVSQENKDKLCDAYKEMMIEYARTNEHNNKYYINLDDLEELDKVKKDCQGYVTIDYNEEGIPMYEAHISCSNGCQSEDYMPETELTGTRTIVVPACIDNVIYNGQSQNLISPGLGYTLSNERRINIGKQNVIVNISDKGNFSWSDQTQDEKVIRDCELKKREVTLVADNKEFTYLGTPPTYTYHILNTVKVNGQTENPLGSGVGYTVKDSNGHVVNVTSTTPAGTYTIIPSSTVTNNYKLIIQNGTLTINKMPITVVAGDASKTYDGNSLSTNACSFEESLAGHTVTCVMTNDSTITNAGTVSNTIETVNIRNATEDVTVNFAVTNVDGTLTINKRTLNVIADNKEKWHKQNNPTLTETYSGQVPGETPKFSGSLTTPATQNSAIGMYDINQGTRVLANNGSFLANNYTISFTKGTLTIKDPCVSTKLNCDNVSWGSCSATYSDDCSGSKNGTGTYYSNHVSGYKCGTGTCTTSCCGSQPRPSSGGGGDDSGDTNCCPGYNQNNCLRTGGTCYCNATGYCSGISGECAGAMYGGCCYGGTTRALC